MHLGDRGGSQRLGVEMGKHHLRLATQVFQQLGPQRLQRHRRHMAVQLLKLGNPLGTEQVGAPGQDLPELDEGGAQLLDCQVHLHRRRQPRQVGGGGVPAQHMASALQAVSQPKTAHRVAQAVANEHAQNGVESAHIAGGTQGFDQHARMIGAHWFRS